MMQQPRRRVAPALMASLACHALAIVLLSIAIRSGAHAGREVQRLSDRSHAPVVWLADAARAGGGGGGGNRMKPPPRRVELPGRDALTVPVAKPVRLESAPPAAAEPNPVERLAIPAERLAAGLESLPGTMSQFGVDLTSLGPGDGGGAGTRSGSGDGPGRGPGFGPGYEEGAGDEIGSGAGVTIPRVVREVKPQYTAGAMNARLQGSVLLDCVVRPDGSVGDLRVRRSLDPIFGLDQEAVKAAAQWRFLPGIRAGKPVAVRVTIELLFTIR